MPNSLWLILCILHRLVWCKATFCLDMLKLIRLSNLRFELFGLPQMSEKIGKTIYRCMFNKLSILMTSLAEWLLLILCMVLLALLKQTLNMLADSLNE